MDNKIRGIIYSYTSPNGKRYIGQTTREHERHAEFLNKNNKYAGFKINQARIKYGVESFKYEILYENYYDNIELALDDLNKQEKKYIAEYDSCKNGYNIEPGGICIDSISTYEDCKCRMIKSLKEHYKNNPNKFKGISNEERFGKEKATEISKKISKARKGQPSSFKGKHWSDSQRKFLSEMASKRTGEKNAFYGKKHSEETKAKIGKENSKAVVQIDKTTNEILNEFNSAKAAGEYFGRPRANSEIVKVCRKYVSPSGRNYLTSLGYKWMYKSDIESSTTIERDGKIFLLIK